jgi:hypothetical protein
MFSLFPGASLKIAKNLIKVTGVKDGLKLFLSMNLSNVNKTELYIQMLALNATNLLQTMKEDFISKEIDSEDSQDIVDDYVIENLRHQEFIPIRDGAELMDKCQEIEGYAQKFRIHWLGEGEQTGPEPRYFCVMDVLRKLGNEKNHFLQDTLFDFVTLQHQHFTHYFETLLKPIEEPEIQPLPVAAPEVPAAQEVSKPEPLTEDLPLPVAQEPEPVSQEIPSAITPETVPVAEVQPAPTAQAPEPVPVTPNPLKDQDMSWLERLFCPETETPAVPKSVAASGNTPSRTLQPTPSSPAKESPDNKVFDLPKMENPFHL